MGDGAIVTSNTRTARHYEITVGSSPRRVPKQSLAAIVKTFAAASAKGDAVWRQGETVFEIARVRFNKSATRAIVLIRFADAGAAEASAHLLIDCAPSTDGIYRAVLEEAPGLTKALLDYAMEALARRLFSFYAMGPGGHFVQAYPRLSFAASSAVPAELMLERAPALCEPEIRPDVSVKLDELLKRRTARMPAAAA